MPITLPYRSWDHAGNYGECDDCLAPLVRGQSGALCPNGHGRIIPVVVHLDAYLRKVPAAERVSQKNAERYRIDGYGSKVFKTAVVNQQVSSWYAKRRPTGAALPAGVVIAKLKPNYRLLCFEEVKEEAAVAAKAKEKKKGPVGRGGSRVAKRKDVAA